MIINTNALTLTDSGVTLEETYVSSYSTVLKNDKLESVKADCQVGFFQSIEKLLIGGGMALRVAGFDKSKTHLTFDYPIEDEHPFYYFDVQTKAYLLECFPEWDADKLVITTEPTEEA